MGPNTWTEIPKESSLWKITVFQTLSKALNISSATTQVAPELLNALPVLLATTVRRSEVDWEKLKPCWKSENITHFLRWLKTLLLLIPKEIIFKAGWQVCLSKFFKKPILFNFPILVFMISFCTGTFIDQF